MPADAVKLPVAASVPFECEFWPEDDGWTGSCPQLTVAVRGNNFEEAKKNMEEALQSRIESILRSHSDHAAA
jgi:predicted RNase H-like HicB family nuclease